MKKNTCVELITSYGTFIGMFDSVDEEKTYIKNVMKINLTPMPTEDGKNYMMIPKPDLINYYSLTKSLFSFPNKDIIFMDEVVGSRFIEGYVKQFAAYEEMKTQQGSNVEVVQSVPENLK